MTGADIEVMSDWMAFMMNQLFLSDFEGNGKGFATTGVGGLAVGRLKLASALVLGRSPNRFLGFPSSSVSSSWTFEDDALADAELQASYAAVAGTKRGAGSCGFLELTRAASLRQISAESSLSAS